MCVVLWRRSSRRPTYGPSQSAVVRRSSSRTRAKSGRTTWTWRAPRSANQASGNRPWVVPAGEEERDEAGVPAVRGAVDVEGAEDRGAGAGAAVAEVPEEGRQDLMRALVAVGQEEQREHAAGPAFGVAPAVHRADDGAAL